MQQYVFTGEDDEQKLHHRFGYRVWRGGRVASAACSDAMACTNWYLVGSRMGFVAGGFAGR